MRKRSLSELVAMYPEPMIVLKHSKVQYFLRESCLGTLFGMLLDEEAAEDGDSS